MTKLTKLSKKVLNRLIKTNYMKPHELVHELDMNLRSIRYALKLLEDQQLIERRPDFEDLRTYYYYVRPEFRHEAKKLAV